MKKIAVYGVLALASICAMGAGPEMWVSPPADAVRVETAPPLDGTGNFVVSPRTTWADVPAYQTGEGVPHGRLVHFEVPSTASDMYPGVAGPYTRNVWVYVPAGYVEGTVLPLMVDHDGRADAVIQTTLIAVMDNLIAAKRLPMMAGLFIANGGDGRPSERSLEYDTVSGRYGEYIESVIVPLAEKEANVKFTRDGNGRGVIGQSSGSAAALAMAWFHNALYTRVISYSGTFVTVQNSEQFPRGAWEYHAHLIPESPKKNLRIWMHVSDRDNSFNVPEERYRNWPLANNHMAEVLQAKGYEYQYLWSTDSGHVERGVERQTLEQAMEWVWKTYRPTRPSPQETEVWDPEPRVVTPGVTDAAPPSDAIVLFGGTNLDQWESTSDRSPAGWSVADGVLTVNKSAGDIQTRRSFTNYQLHLEWKIPADITGADQARGNSGLFLATTGNGQYGYELQILDSYNNRTYSNGQAGSIYKQSIPLVNAAREPGLWQTYDVVWTAPTFAADGKLLSPARVTVFHNGVLVQNHFALTGDTRYIGKPTYAAHGAAPIRLQAHGDPSAPISFRNIWVRELP